MTHFAWAFDFRHFSVLLRVDARGASVRGAAPQRPDGGELNKTFQKRGARILAKK
jgi:hypothetical protein